MEAVYALLVNQSAPPTTVGNVIIEKASPSPNIPATATEQLPQPSGTARPLHDSTGNGGMTIQNKIPNIIAVMSTLLVIC